MAAQDVVILNAVKDLCEANDWGRPAFPDALLREVAGL
jgi:hypothetical protein